MPAAQAIQRLGHVWSNVSPDVFLLFKYFLNDFKWLISAQLSLKKFMFIKPSELPVRRFEKLVES